MVADAPTITPSSTRDIQLLTVKQVARMLSLSTVYVYQLAQNGVLPTVRFGKHAVRFEKGAIERWIAEKQSGGR